MKFVLVVLFSIFSLTANAASISLLHGNTYKQYSGEEEDKEIITIDHFGTYKYGTIFFFYDISNGQRSEDRSEFFGSISPTMSFSKVSGSRIEFGPVTDVSLKLELEHVSGVTPIYYYGLQYDLHIPKFAYANVSTVLRDDVQKKGVGGQLNMAWGRPFRIAKEGHFMFTGFIAAGVIPEDKDEFFLTTQPQLLYDMWKFTDSKKGSAYIGVEYSYAVNRYLKKGTIDPTTGEKDSGFDEQVTQAMIKISY